MNYEERKTAAILDFDSVHLIYGGGDEVLSDISLSVEAGEVIGLLGRNGAGKTTLINLVMGLLGPQRGNVRVFGEDPRRRPVEVKRRIGFVSEDQQLPPFLKVGQVFDLYAGLFPDWDDAFAREMAGRFDLPRDRKISKLSKGQARQVALIGAVAHRPKLLVLDEPAGGLDPAVRREFLETSIRLLNEEGTTILFSSHHMGDVERLASRLVMIHEKEKWIDSRLDDIREGYSLALLPVREDITGERLLRMEGCLCARVREDAVRAVFHAGAADCAEQLCREFSLSQAQCSPIALEEMFIELVGRGS